MALPLAYFSVSTGGLHGDKAREVASVLRPHIPAGWGDVVVRGLVVGFWELAAQRGEDDGHLGKRSARQLARGAGWPLDPDVLLDAFVEARLLDRVGDEWRVHDWADHQPAIRERMRKRRRLPDPPGTSGNVQEPPPKGREAERKGDRKAGSENASPAESSTASAELLGALYEEILVPAGWPPPPRAWPDSDDARSFSAISESFGADVDWWRGALEHAARGWLTTQAKARKRWVSLRGVFLDAEKLGSLVEGLYDDAKARGTSEKDDAIGAWTLMVAEAKKSPDRRERPADARARSALSSVGGFATIGRSSQRDLPKLRSRFVDAFLSAHDVADDDHDGAITPLFGGDRRAS